MKTNRAPTGNIRGNRLESTRLGAWRERRGNPFRRFKTSSEIIRLTVMLRARFSLSLRFVEDLRHQPLTDINLTMRIRLLN